MAKSKSNKPKITVTKEEIIKAVSKCPIESYGIPYEELLESPKVKLFLSRINKSEGD